jgi:hypothetical protein
MHFIGERNAENKDLLSLVVNLRVVGSKPDRGAKQFLRTISRLRAPPTKLKGCRCNRMHGCNEPASANFDLSMGFLGLTARRASKLGELA